MPFVQSPDGIKIHYEVEGQGPPLLLHHGFGSTPERWRWEGYVDALKANYSLILMAARGHGQSDKPLDEPAYAWRRRVDDIKAVLDDVQADRAIYWGYSMGGQTGFAMLKMAPERLQAAILGGSNPYSRPVSNYEDRIKLLEQGMGAYLANLERQTGPMPEARRKHYESSDPRAWIALLRSRPDDEPLDDQLTGVRVPTLIYCGTKDDPHDGAKQAAATIPGAEFVSLPGLAHRDAIERSDLVLPFVTQFLDRVLAKVS